MCRRHGRYSRYDRHTTCHPLGRPILRHSRRHRRNHRFRHAGREFHSIVAGSRQRPPGPSQLPVWSKIGCARVVLPCSDRHGFGNRFQPGDPLLAFANQVLPALRSAVRRDGLLVHESGCHSAFRTAEKTLPVERRDQTDDRSHFLRRPCRLPWPPGVISNSGSWDRDWELLSAWQTRSPARYASTAAVCVRISAATKS